MAFFRDTTNSGIVTKSAAAESPVIGHIDSVSMLFLFLSNITWYFWMYYDTSNCFAVLSQCNVFQEEFDKMTEEERLAHVKEVSTYKYLPSKYVT